MQVTARYQLDGDDGLECLRVHDPTYRKSIVVSVLASMAIIAIGLVYLVLPGGDTLPWVTIGIGATVAGFSLLQWAYLVRRLRRTWNQIEPMELVVREDGLVAATRGVHSDVAWSRFVRLKESKSHFLLYTSADLYNIVPKRGFVNQQDVETFRKWAKQGIGGK